LADSEKKNPTFEQVVVCLEQFQEAFEILTTDRINVEVLRKISFIKKCIYKKVININLTKVDHCIMGCTISQWMTVSISRVFGFVYKFSSHKTLQVAVVQAFF